MFRLNQTIRSLLASAALSAGVAMVQAQIDAPANIVDAAKNEVKDGKIVRAYLDEEITTSDVYRVFMTTPGMDRRLTIRSDGVVLHNERLYEPIEPDR